MNGNTLLTLPGPSPTFPVCVSVWENCSLHGKNHILGIFRNVMVVAWSSRKDVGKDVLFYHNILNDKFIMAIKLSFTCSCVRVTFVVIIKET